MAKERPVEITPSAAALVESLRGLGYSPETAIADLIDNSIAAEAATIELEIEWNDGHPQVALFDNGNGMDRTTLAEALRFGGTGPASTRTASDLGRFGLGLKTASLSQCRQITIISRTVSKTSALVLDVDEIAKRGWFATVPAVMPKHPLVTKLAQLEHGTVVLWDRMDSLGGLSGLAKETFYLRLEDLRAHLGMVFHRFIDGDATRLAIICNGRAIKAWDPFQTGHPSTRELPSERIRHAGSAFTVRPYVLPHRDRFANEAEYETAGGHGGWAARQGFYVYRGKRMLVAGSWLGLGGVRTWTRDEASRLARIEVDLPTDLDRDWRIDVRKSQARPPGTLRARLTAIGGRCRQEAREVFAFRGQGAHARGLPHAAPTVWLALKGPKGLQYRINREHPLVVAFRNSAGGVRPLNAMLSIIERSVPIERIWLDVSETEATAVTPMDANEIAQLSNQLLELGKALPASMTPDQRANMLLVSLPGDLTELRAELVRRMREAT
ncbi:ATP-binding protein [Tardiphaga sp. vice304]|nr:MULTISPECIES: ATP-binding protein [unclassified Tardiphaga]QDM15777.1 ATP-binding protein [Tardiphaga sp. vice278]QDM20877.1 ATP-binding protein [Tardiphaga sp. vice154]QDM25973.1 ATP-binding protein [Tardiphaga sp. vice304]